MSFVRPSFRGRKPSFVARRQRLNEQRRLIDEAIARSRDRLAAYMLFSNAGGIGILSAFLGAYGNGHRDFPLVLVVSLTLYSCGAYFALNERSVEFVQLVSLRKKIFSDDENENFKRGNGLAQRLIGSSGEGLHLGRAKAFNASLYSFLAGSCIALGSIWSVALMR